MKKFVGAIGLAVLLSATFSSVSLPSRASGGGNTGGGNTGGGVKVVEARITGYVTAIDYEHSTITVGASYYGNGSLQVTSATKTSLNNSNCDFSAIHLGDWAEARYDVSNRNATKLTCTR